MNDSRKPTDDFSARPFPVRDDRQEKGGRGDAARKGLLEITAELGPIVNTRSRFTGDAAR